MEYEEILRVLAPCGLDCSRCIGYERGEVRGLALKLREQLEGVDSYAEEWASFVPAFAQYPAFREVLEVFAEADCAMCRGNEAKYPLCPVARCISGKDFDFCFQCEDFPCDPEGFYPNLRERWLKMNNRMKEIGVEAYFEETMKKPRYK